MSLAELKYPIRRILFWVSLIGALSYAQSGSAQGWTYPGNIDHHTFAQTIDGDIVIDGKIDGGSHVTLTSNYGSIVIRGKIDGGSVVYLTAKRNIQIGTTGGSGDRKIDGRSQVYATAGGFFYLGNKIDAGVTNLNGNLPTHVVVLAGRGIEIGDKIDGTSWVQLCTKAGRIHVHGKIDGPGIVAYWPAASLIVDGRIQGGRLFPDQAYACQRGNAPPG